MASNTHRYHRALIALHWVMALSIIVMLASGLFMTYADIGKSLQFRMIQWHKSLGVLVLCSVILRVIIRQITHVPPLPEALTHFEKKAAKLGHVALYGWMLLVPLAGWVMVSASPYGLPTIVFGWFEWPHIPNIAGDKAIGDVAATAHAWLAYAFIALILGHVLAVIKHARRPNENVLPRMGIGK